MSGKACALGAGTGDPEREPTWQQRGRKIGEAARDTQRPASPQALCSVILQQLPSGSWTRATETFVVVIAPNTYLHLAHLWVPHSEGSTLSVITRGPWGLRVGLRPQSLHLTQLRAAGIKMTDTKHPAPSCHPKLLINIGPWVPSLHLFSRIVSTVAGLPLTTLSAPALANPLSCAPLDYQRLLISVPALVHSNADPGQTFLK